MYVYSIHLWSGQLAVRYAAMYEQLYFTAQRAGFMQIRTTDACPFSTILCLINQLSEEVTKEHQSSTRQGNALYSSCLRYVASNLSIFNCYGIWRDLLTPS